MGISCLLFVFFLPFLLEIPNLYIENMALSLQQKIGLKVHLTDAEWQDFSSRWVRKSFVKNEYITQDGQIERYFYFVLSGVQRGFFIRNGIEHCVGFSYPPDFSGVYDSFLAQKPSDYYMQAITDSEMLGIHFEDLNEMFYKYKSIERWGRLFNEEMLLGKAHREIAMITFSAEERFMRLFNDSPQCFQLIPQKYLASYLGMKPETFSRLKRRIWEKHRK